jgi:hypothetical protein
MKISPRARRFFLVSDSLQEALNEWLDAEIALAHDNPATVKLHNRLTALAIVSERYDGDAAQEKYEGSNHENPGEPAEDDEC